MKRRLTITFIVVGLLLLCGCSSKTDSTEVLNEEAVENEEITEIKFDQYVDMSTGEVVSPEIVEAAQSIESAEEVLSADEVLEVYDHLMAMGDFEQAGHEIYWWLKDNKSDEVMDKLMWLREHVCMVDCICTVYDADDSVMSSTKYTYDEKGNLTLEELEVDGNYEIVQSCQYVYSGDLLVSQMNYDDYGNLLYSWEGEYNDDKTLKSESEGYNNLTVSGLRTHKYNEDGLCIQELSTFTGYEDDGSVTNRAVDFEYDGDLLIKETTRDNDLDILETCAHYYDNYGKLTRSEWYDGDYNLGEAIDYEYDYHDNLLKETLTDGTHIEWYEYTYDKFNDQLTRGLYVHDILQESWKYEYDFAGNIVMIKSDGSDGLTTSLYAYTYAFRE